jgi:hypothetical protein
MNVKAVLSIALGCIGLLVLAACAPPAASPAPAAEEAPAFKLADVNEPNDACQDAIPLAPDEEMTGILGSAGDTDMYVIEVELNTPVVVTLTLRHPEPEPFEFDAFTQCQVEGEEPTTAEGVVSPIAPRGVADYYGDDVVLHMPATEVTTAEETIVTFNLVSETGLVYLAVEGSPEFFNEVPHNVQVQVKLTEKQPIDVPSR